MRLTTQLTPWEMQELEEHFSESSLYHKVPPRAWLHRGKDGVECMLIELQENWRNNMVTLSVEPKFWSPKACEAYLKVLLERYTSHVLRATIQAVIAPHVGPEAPSVTQKVLQAVYEYGKAHSKAQQKQSLYVRRLVAAGKRLAREQST